MPVKFFLVACLLAGLGLAAANDIPIRFCAKNCTGSAIPGLQVHLSGCTDTPVYCTTGTNGCCSIDRAPKVVQYCHGSARNFCHWSIFSSGLNLAPDVTTLTRNGVPVTARDYSCCKCAGGGEFCPNVIYGDAATKSCPGGLRGISTSSSSGYFTVNFTPRNCCQPPPPASCANYSCPGSSSLKSPLPDLSGGLLRNDVNCCNPPTCAGYNCTSGSLISPLPTLGLNASVGDATCCTPPTCAGYPCPYNNPKLPPPSGFGLVVNEATCCIPTCSGYHCTSGSLKSPPPTGAGVVRNDVTCCNPPTCAGYNCTSGSLISPPPTLGLNASVGDATCCTPPTCAGYPCPYNNPKLPPPSGFGLMVNEATCCIPTCSGYHCTSGSLKSPPPTGAGVVRDDVTCCNPPTCAGYTCPYNNPKLPPPSGFGLVVNEANCCIPTCSGYHCTSGSLKSPPPTGAGVVRNDVTCCNPPTCAGYPCPYNNPKSPAPSGFGLVVNEANCCIPTCSGYNCTSGSPKSPPPIGDGVVRNDVTCCNPPTCAGYPCPHNNPKSPAPSGFGLVVNEANCCIPPTCAGYPCPYNNPKSPAPSGFGLVVNEANCCVPTCSGYVCPSGSLKSPVPMGDGVVRNDATCCDACPLTCSVTVSKDNGMNSVSEVVPGDCSSALTGGNATTCPDEYFQSNETCPGGNCGVCCFLRTGLCGAGITGPCAGQPGAACQCFESDNGANCAATNLHVPPSYNASLIEGGGGCQENNCNAVAAKSGKAGSCCPYPCTGPGNSGKKKAFRRFG